jgi:hypothetical protein
MMVIAKYLIRGQDRELLKCQNKECLSAVIGGTTKGF